jgi:hypothetical protein
MAGRQGRGALGNSTRDLLDDFVGVAADPCKGGKPPRWPPNPTRVKTNTFHAKVSGNSASKRVDRSPSFRRGHFMRKG